LGQVWHHFLLHDFIKVTKDVGAELMLLCKGCNILENFFATVYFCLFEGHILIDVVIEGGRHDISAYLSDPLLQRVAVKCLFLGCFDVGKHCSVPVLQRTRCLFAVVAVERQGIFEHFLHLFEESLGLISALGRAKRGCWFFIETTFLEFVRDGSDLEAIELHSERCKMKL
jgi:hypothetical protein